MAKASAKKTASPATESKKGGRKPAPKDESKGARFLRLATPRMTKAIKALQVIGNLSGGGYEYTQEQVDKMRAALNAEMEKAFTKFAPKQPGEKKAQPGFSFE